MKAQISLSKIANLPGATFRVRYKNCLAFYGKWSDWKFIDQEECDKFCADLNIDKVEIKVPESVHDGLVSSTLYQLDMLEETVRIN